MQVSVRAALLALAALPSKSLESVLSSFSHLDAVPFEKQSFFRSSLSLPISLKVGENFLLTVPIKST